MPDRPVITVDLDDTLWDAGPTLSGAEQGLYDWLADHCPRVTARYGMEDMTGHRRALAAARPGIAHDLTALRLTSLRALLEEAGYAAGLAERAMEHFLELRNRVRLFDDALPALRALGERYRLVALTNGNACVHRIGIGHLFTLAVSPAEAGVAKPDPGMFGHVLAALDARPTQVLHVGDDPYYDVEAAHRAGVACVWVNRASRPWPGPGRPAQAEVASLEALPDLVARMLPGQGP